MSAEPTPTPPSASAAEAAPPAPAASAAAAPAPSEPPKEPSDVVLTRFFETSSAARKAAHPLKKGAEVGVHFTDLQGEWRFTVVDDKPRLLREPARDPDFVLTLGPGAVTSIAGKPDNDVGDLGILFFQHMLAARPEDKVRVKLHSGVIKLTLRGYLGVLALGGPKVVGWLAQKGLKGPGAVAAAVSKLKKG